MFRKPYYLRRFFTWSGLPTSEIQKYPCLNRVVNSLTQPTHLPNLYQINAQLKDFVKAGRLNDARQLFDEMPQRDEVSWTNVISGYVNVSNHREALNLFARMWVDPSVGVDIFVLSLAVKASGLDNNVAYGKLLHGVSVKNSLINSVFVGSSLVDMYAKCGEISESCRVFDEMPERNVVSWTAIITGLVKSGYCKEGLKYFSNMLISRVHCDAYCFAIALKACADSCDVAHGKEIHTQVLKRGFNVTAYVANTLATMYNKCGKMDYGMCLFGRIRTPDVVGWTSLITSYVQMGRDDVAVQQFILLRKSDVSANEYTFAAVIAACAHLGKLNLGEQLHALVTKMGVMDVMSVANSIMTLYSKCGRLNLASEVFRTMARKDVVSWSSIIAGYSQAGYAKEAFEFLSWMRREGPTVNEYALASALSVAGSMAILKQGKQVHAHTLKVGLDHTSLVQSALITMYAKCGSIKDASEIYNSTTTDDVVSWTSMVNGFAEHGHSHEAIELFEKKLKVGLRPDTVTFVGVLSACNHAGLVDLGYRYFNSMSDEFNITPSRQHYGCMIDLLCKAGKLVEAENMISSMPADQDDEVVWSTYLRACRTHGEVERAIYAAERILKLNPSCAGTLTTLANIYSAKGQWQEAADVRKLMRSKGVIKEAGSSWIEIEDDFTAFVSGDRTHPRGDHIYNVLDLVTSGVDASIPEVDTLLFND